MDAAHNHRKLLSAGLASAALLFLLGAMVTRLSRRSPPPADPQPPLAAIPVEPVVRTEPPHFPKNTHLPDIGESKVSGGIDLDTFDPEQDLVHVDDPCVWWESDHDSGDAEDDHVMHRSVEPPLRRLVELVTENGGALEVHDAYRPTGIHNPRSLHKEGRAVDLTCDQFPLEKLAKLCWVAGFDWVYYEDTGRGGAHLHCSVKRQPLNRAQATPPPPDDAAGTRSDR